MKKHINEFQTGALAQFFLKEHSGGYFRDESDLHSAKMQTLISISNCLDIIENIEGTIEEKIAYLKNELNQIDKFHGKTTE